VNDRHFGYITKSLEETLLWPDRVWVVDDALKSEATGLSYGRQLGSSTA